MTPRQLAYVKARSAIVVWKHRHPEVTPADFEVMTLYVNDYTHIEPGARLLDTLWLRARYERDRYDTV